MATAESPVSIDVNGARADVRSHPRAALLWVLRDELGLASPKYGCGAEQCGACRVLIDGQLAYSCAVTAAGAAGRSVTTLESLRDTPAGERVVAALLAHDAAQCGYCLPGIAVTLTWLAGQESVDRHDALRALDVHLCRCGSHPRILAAAGEALGWWT